MKLMHEYFETPIDFQENFISVLVVENPKILSELISELINQINTDEGRFVLSESSKILKISKEINLIIDPFSLDLNNKKVQNKLLSTLKDIALSDFYLDTQELIGKLNEFLFRITDEFNLPLEFNDELDMGSLLKVFDLKVISLENTLLEIIKEYIRVMNMFCSIQVFVFVNLKLFLSNEEIEDLYIFAKYEKQNLLLVENIVHETRHDELLKLIDVDLCELGI